METKECIQYIKEIMIMSISLTRTEKFSKGRMEIKTPKRFDK